MSKIEYKRYPYEDLKEFCYKLFRKLGVPEEDAYIPGECLLKADLMGDPSHGVYRLNRYIFRFSEGLVKAKPDMKIIKSGLGFFIYDADNGLGQIAGNKAMKICIERAKSSGFVYGLISNSNHFGKCGYYSMLALEHDMIGLSMTNSSPLVAPTFGIEPIIGTNPIAIAVPTDKELPFCFDMATTVRAYGRVDTLSRVGQEVPIGWSQDNYGNITSDPWDVLGKEGYSKSEGDRGTMLPLGGFGDYTAGYKGYGLGIMVDILTGILAGGAWGPFCGMGMDSTISKLRHSVCAINIEAFRPLDEFKKDMDAMLRGLKNSKKSIGYDRIVKATEDGFVITLNRRKEKFKRIYTAGEKGLELESEQMKNGILLGSYVVKELKEINKKYNIGYTF